MENRESFSAAETKELHRCRLGTLGSGLAKEKLLEACLAAPAPLKDDEWGHNEEAELQRLKSTEIKFEDAALAVALDQNAKSVARHADKLSDMEAAALINALQQRNNNNNNNAGTDGGDNQLGIL